MISRVCFARGRFVEFIDPFLSKRGRGGETPSIRGKKFLRSSSFDGGGGERGESLREGEGEKHASSHVQLFYQRGARDRRERLLLEPRSTAPLSPLLPRGFERGNTSRLAIPRLGHDLPVDGRL